MARPDLNLDRKDLRRRVGQAVVTWLGLALAGISILGALIVWHLSRRARLIREGLGPPRAISPLDDPLPDADPDPAGPE